ncbi:MobB family relaxase [Tissierella sp.]|uniref:MobB family relaxase n=1 Tax=Tissierella sp. TaxID=41274 RepID=UPI00306BE9B4
MYHNFEENEKTINKGCRDLIEYLDKEEKMTSSFVNYLDKESALEEKLYFFNGTDREIENETVVNAIENNRKGLNKNEAYFYALTIDPSEKEIKHVYDEYAKKIADALKETGMPGTIEQIEEGVMRRLFTDYAIKCMDEYALNFGRESIKSNEDLVWFGRVEKNRYWKKNSTEVIHNKKIYDKISKLMQKPQSQSIQESIKELKQNLIFESDVREGGKPEPIYEMMPKSGDNYHIHIIVSRKDKTQKIKLSPKANARSSDKHKVGGRECKIGFDRNKFTNRIEKSFDTKFLYDRPIEESYEFKNEQKKSNEKSEYQRMCDIINDIKERSNTEQLRVQEHINKVDAYYSSHIPYFIAYDGYDPFAVNLSEESKPNIGFMTKEEYNAYLVDPGADEMKRLKSTDERLSAIIGELHRLDRDIEYILDERKGRELFKPKIRLFDAKTELPKSFDFVKCTSLDKPIKHAQKVLSEVLPYCHTIGDFCSLMRENGVIPDIYRNDKGYKDLRFTFVNDSHTIELRDLDQKTNFYQIKRYIEHEWREYYFQDKIQKFNEPTVSHPEGAQLDISKITDKEYLVQFVKNTLHECLPYCNNFDDLTCILHERGISFKESRDEKGFKELCFSIEDTDDIFRLQDLPGDVNYYDIKDYLQKEWQEYFYPKKVQKLNKPAIVRPNPVLFEASQRADRKQLIKYVERSLHECLPYCNSMNDFKSILQERGILLSANKDDKSSLLFQIEQYGIVDLKEISKNLNRYDLELYLEREWKKYFYQPKQQEIGKDTVSRPKVSLFDPSSGTDRLKQIQFVEHSLREIFPFSNSMKDLTDLLKERGVISEVYKEGNTTNLRFSINGINDSPIRLQDISDNLKYYELKYRVEREWKEYFYQPQIQQLGSVPVIRPDAVRFDISKGTEPGHQVKFIENTLRECLPYCNTMEQLTSILKERGIDTEIFREDLVGVNMRFSIEGANYAPVCLKDISDNLNYYDLKKRIEREWRIYYYQDKIQKFNAPAVMRPEVVEFDPFVSTDFIYQVEFVEKSLRDSLPYCNTMGEFAQMLEERGIIADIYVNSEGFRDIRFYIEGISDSPINLHELSGDLRFYEIKSYIEHEWRQYYFQDKIQEFDKPAVPHPEAVQFDDSQGMEPEHQVKFIENSLRECLPYCNTMDELTAMLQERGITPDVYKNEEGQRDIRFMIEGVSREPVKLQDLAGDLHYYDLKNYIEREWRQYYFQDKIQEFDKPAVSHPDAVQFDTSQGTEPEHQVKFIENSLRDCLPYCNTMDELTAMLKERGIVPEVYKNEKGQRDIHFMIEGASREPVKLQDLAGDLHYYDLKNYIEREWRQYYFQDKIQEFDKPAVSHPDAVQFDTSQGTEPEHQVKFIENSLRDCLPYCSTMDELTAMLQERGINPEIYKNEEEQRDIRFMVEDVSREPVKLQDLAGDLHYYDLKNYIEREWRQYYFQDKIQEFDKPTVSHPDAVQFDTSQGTEPEHQVKFIENSLRDCLPYCNTMDELTAMLQERGITPEVYKNQEGYNDFRFTIEGVSQEPIKLQDLTGSLGYYDIKRYIEREWREYYFQDKIQRFNAPEVPIPSFDKFDRSLNKDRSSHAKFVEESLRNVLPYCNTMDDLTYLLEKRGITLLCGDDGTGRKTLYFNLGTKYNIELKELSGDLNFYDIQNYIVREWKEYFYQPKKVDLNRLSVSQPDMAKFDISQGTGLEQRIRFVEDSLRESLPYCNKMDDLLSILKERGITAEVYRDESGLNINFRIEGIHDEPIRLQDISVNLNYYDVKRYIQKEWNKSFFLPKDQDLSNLHYSTFDTTQYATSEMQQSYIKDTLQKTLPYCNSFSELKEELSKQSICLDPVYDRETGRDLLFHIKGIDNVVQFRLQDLHPNLDYWNLVSHVGKDDLLYHNYQLNRLDLCNTILQAASQKLMYETGLKYIHDCVKPYQQTATLGMSGLKILTSDRLAREKALLLSKSMATTFAYKIGFTALGSLNQYISPYFTAVSFIKQGISAGLSGHDR